MDNLLPGYTASVGYSAPFGYSAVSPFLIITWYDFPNPVWFAIHNESRKNARKLLISELGENTKVNLLLACILGEKFLNLSVMPYFLGGRNW